MFKKILLINFVILILSSSAAAQNAIFPGQQLQPGGSAPFSGGFIDVNADGRPDVAAVGSGTLGIYDGTVSILKNLGGTLFGAATVFTVGAQTDDVQLIDCNGDGKRDILVASRASEPLIGNVSMLAGDGILDLIITNSNNTIGVVPGGGIGGFKAPSSVNVGLFVAAVMCKDVNHDSLPDLIISTMTINSVRVALASGGGSFSPFIHYPAGNFPSELAMSDINEDGHADIIVSNSMSAFSCVKGIRDGTFGPKTTFGTLSGAGISAEDINNDGHVDIIQSHFSFDTIAMYLGTGAGTFGAAQKLTVGVGPFREFVTDINSDGVTDIVVGTSDSVAILTASTPGVFSRSNYVSPFGGIAINDLNADGRMDIMRSSSTHSR